MADRMKSGCSTLSLAEAATELKTTIPRLLILIRSGELEAHPVDGDWQISWASIRACSESGIPRLHGNGCGSCGGCGA